MMSMFGLSCDQPVTGAANPPTTRTARKNVFADNVLSPDLHNSSDESNQITNNQKQVIIVEPIRLANYLDQPGIVLQTDKNKIQVLPGHNYSGRK